MQNKRQRLEYSHLLERVIDLDPETIWTTLWK